MLNSQCQNVSRISNQFRKIEFRFIPTKQPFGMVISKNNIKKSAIALHLENFRKVRKFSKNTIFIYEISQNFGRFQRISTGAKKILRIIIIIIIMDFLILLFLFLYIKHLLSYLQPFVFLVTFWSTYIQNVPDLLL